MIPSLEKKLNSLSSGSETGSMLGAEVTDRDIAAVISRATGIPVEVCCIHGIAISHMHYVCPFSEFAYRRKRKAFEDGISFGEKRHWAKGGRKSHKVTKQLWQSK